MHIRFVTKEHGPERLVSEAEIHFEEGFLAGMKLVGISLWRGADGDTYVTMPARAFGMGQERRFFDFLRSAEPGGTEDLKRVKAHILDEFRAQRAA
ncbi:MAG: hypothetical protein MUF51_02430 [Vicinamibacteria bacterium]|jgi:hypothetical protein|nr:hypothetical protein [Vicinamibacteria bacterium]